MQLTQTIPAILLADAGHGEATTFFRPGAWGNAYVVVWDLIWNALH